MDASAIAIVPPLSSSAGPDRPLITFVDDATGERADLSSTDLGAWAARTAALLREGCGLEAGARAAVLLPAHWQTAAILLGAWSVGVSISFRGWATAGLPALGEGNDEPFDVTFVAADRVDSWIENVPAARHAFVLGFEPGGAPMPRVPDGYLDHAAEVGRYDDAPPPYALVRPGDAATVDGTTYAEWWSLAEAMAGSLDLTGNDRVLVDTAEIDHPVKWLLAPLAVGASVVLCANLDQSRLAARIRTEQVTRLLGA